MAAATTIKFTALTLVCASFLSACVQVDDEPRFAFFERFQPYCGQAFAATVVEDNQPSAAWQQPLVVHIRDCEANTIRMPLHVGDDRSRTWVLNQTADYLDFQHIHLHEDGSPDAVSPYGGHTVAMGSADIQAFPVDDASKALFKANGLDVSMQNTWTFEFVDAQTLEYQLSRPNRIFRVQIDLSQPVDIPPPAWGYQP
ncbi:hypothetical protein [Pseudidiomarina taiwanensis]|uniref:Secreted protein n=1 Tax=Pseudidiomarina taiwanensis TaxID=337250 RepID=A0A432ZEG1_9GAMM|nr:hypothetical protein [Pseudidiomarina taiwanensis]RUO76311.1 hypothetical protein CWI83_08055 [Pseudidiomarina taiwanensis]